MAFSCFQVRRSLLRVEAGTRPGGRGTFLCFAKEKSPKERRPEVWVPPLRCGQPALLDSGGGPQNSLRSNNCGPDPASICAARPSHTGQVGTGTKSTRTRHGVSLWTSVFVFESPTLVNAPRSTGPGGSGLALSEPKASLARPRLDRAPQVARSEAKGRRHQGRLFLGYFLLAKQKKVTGCRATPASTLSKQHNDQDKDGFAKLTPNGQGRSA